MVGGHGRGRRAGFSDALAGDPTVELLSCVALLGGDVREVLHAKGDEQRVLLATYMKAWERQVERRNAELRAHFESLSAIGRVLVAIAKKPI